MREARVAEILSELEAVLRTAPDAVAAFDGDGTLWSGDVGEDFFHSFVAGGDFRAPARDALAETARDHGVAFEGDGAAIARRLFEAYERGEFSEERICEVIAWAPAGRTPAEYRGFFEARFPPDVMRARLHAETVSLMEGVRRLGVEVFLVSASPKPVVDAAAQTAGIPSQNVIAAEPQVDGATGLVAASVHRPIPYGAGKVHRLRERIGDRSLVVACGDNVFDEELLHHASIRCAVRPKPRLLAIAERIEGLRLLRA